MKLLHIDMQNFNKKNNKKAYSLVEVIVSLGIIAIVITMLFNIILVGLQATVKISARSFVREEISTITSLVARDIRNSDRIEACNDNSCDLIKDGKVIKWEKCEETKVCKYEDTVLTFSTSDNIVINNFEFLPGIGANTDTRAINILFTIIASHKNPNLEVKNVFKQLTISTRNYFL